MAGAIPFNQAAVVDPASRLEMLDMRIDAIVAVRCKCDGGKTFLVRLSEPAKCPACQTTYVVRTLQARAANGQIEGACVVGPAGATLVSPN